MRLKFTDRILCALAGLLIIAISVAVAAFGLGFLAVPNLAELSLVLWQRVAIIVVAALLFLLGGHGVLMMFRSGKETGFILQHTEYGDLSISMSAMENMVKKCIDAHQELRVASTHIHRGRDGVIVTLKIALANGVNIPITVSALQKQIKTYITSCSGVDVKEVRVLVETNNHLTAMPVQPATLSDDVDAAAKAGAVVDSLHETAQSLKLPEEEKPKEKPFHQRLFHRDEAEQIVPQPPAAAEEPTESADTAEEVEAPEAVETTDEPATENEAVFTVENDENEELEAADEETPKEEA